MDKDRCKLILNSTPIAIYGLDLQGNCTFANEACVRMLGYSCEGDFLGRNLHEMIHHTRKDGTPYLEAECKIYQAFRENKSTHVDDEVLWRKDGTSFPAEYWSNRIRDGVGVVVGSVVTWVDISKRLELEADILTSTKKQTNVLTKLREDISVRIKAMKKDGCS